MGHIAGAMTTFSYGFASFLSACAASVKRTFPMHLPLYACAVLFTAITIAVTAAYHAPVTLEASIFFLITVPKFFAVGLFLVAMVQYFRLALRGSRSPVKDFAAWLYRSALDNDRPGNIFHTLVTITPLMVTFSALKEVIPLIRPFSWDQAFVRWDRVLGFGRAPWEWLQPVLGYPAVTWAINYAYDFWFIVVFAALIWQAFFARGGVARMQFLLAFAISWFVAGNVLAVVFSSAGPCYYGLLYGSDPYAAQMAYLRAVNQNWPLASVEIQDYLWQSYVKTRGANFGISAMPSMHVVTTALIALICWRTNRRLGIALVVYTAIVVIGSVHLAWHYAVDGIAGIALALVFWYVAGVIVRAQDRLAHSRRAALVPAGLQPAQE